MSTVTAGLVKELRDLTGAGMMDCKRALEETGGDVEGAQKLLREKGIATAGKRSERETTEGVVLARVDGGMGTMVAVGCETEPVSSTQEFRAFAEHVLEIAHVAGPEAAEQLEGERVELVAKLGENIALRGTARMTAAENEVVSAYVHPPANKIGVLLRAASTPALSALYAAESNVTRTSRSSPLASRARLGRWGRRHGRRRCPPAPSRPRSGCHRHGRRCRRHPGHRSRH